MMIPRHQTFSKMSASLFVGLLSFLLSSQGVSQQLIPRIKNFDKENHPGNLQNWSVDQTAAGEIVFGNDAGLLIFNGETWSLHPLPNQTIIRSVHCEGNRIYVGSYQEFGYFEKSEEGQFFYTSLSEQLPNQDFQNEEFWSIIHNQENVYFQSFTAIYAFHKKTRQTTRLSTPFVPSEIALFDNQLIAFAVDGPAFQFDGEQFREIVTPKVLQTQQVVFANHPTENRAVVCSQNFDCFRFDSTGFSALSLPSFTFFENNQLNVLTIFPNGNLFFSSIQKGGFFYSPTTNESYTVDYNSGLRNNTILGTTIDNDLNLWLALDDGMSYIDHQSANRYYFDYSGELGAVYTAIVYNDNLYLGSNRGLFMFRGDELYKVKGIHNQVWYLQEFNSALYCGHHEGTSIIEGLQAEKISDFTGGWALKQLPNQPNRYLQSSYTGFELIHKDGTIKVDGFVAPIKYFEWLDDKTVLAAQAYKGLYKVEFSDDYRSVVTWKKMNETSLANQYNIRLIKVNQSIYAYAGNWYRYDDLSATMVEDHSIDTLLNDTFSIPTTNDKHTLWGILQNQIVQFNTQQRNKKEFTITIPKDLLVRGYEQIIELDTSNYLLTLNNGFATFGKNAFNNQQNGEAKQPSIISISSEDKKNTSSLQKKFKHNAPPLFLEFATPEYRQAITYEYRLDEQDQWTKTEIGKVILEKISAGKHHFQVRTVYPNNQRSSITSYQFKVQSHPLKRWWAFCIYALLIGLAYLWYKQRQLIKARKKEVELKKQLHTEHLQRVKEKQLEHEKQLAEVKNEQLQHTIDIKKKELANSTLSLVKKNELLSEVKTKLQKATKKESQNQLKEAIRKINQSVSQEENWELFETRFNEVHKEFLDQLKREFPNLTKKDLKLCAYLKMNLTSKEIAPLMNISTRGVETHRYRLRKKLDIETNKNFQKYLENLTD